MGWGIFTGCIDAFDFKLCNAMREWLNAGGVRATGGRGGVVDFCGLAGGDGLVVMNAVA